MFLFSMKSLIFGTNPIIRACFYIFSWNCLSRVCIFFKHHLWIIFCENYSHCFGWTRLWWIMIIIWNGMRLHVLVWNPFKAGKCLFSSENILVDEFLVEIRPNWHQIYVAHADTNRTPVVWSEKKAEK